MGKYGKIVSLVLGHSIEKEYALASKDRFYEIDRGRFPASKDAVILQHHIGSANKEANLYKVKTRILLTKEFIDRHVEPPLSERTFLDVGGSSELFFEIFGVAKGKGTAVNVSDAEVERMRAFGYDGVKVIDERLPFADGAFDYCLSFECLEHTLSPLQSLHEMARVSRRGIFVTIPYRPTTRVVTRTPGASPAIQHIFELSPDDLGRLAAHAGLKMVDYTCPALESGTGHWARRWVRRRRGWGQPSLTIAFLQKA